MAVTVSSALLATANAAASAASDGAKNVAFCGAIATVIGSDYRIVARREGVVVLDMTMSGSLSASSAGISLPDSYETLNTLKDADIDSGTWSLRIENAGDSTVYLNGTLGRSGTDFVLSDDMDPDAGIELSGLFLASPALDSAVSSTLTFDDARVFGWVEPNLAWASQPDPSLGPVATLQISNTWNASRTVRDIPEPGVIGLGSEYAMARVADPANGAKKAILHRVKDTFPKWNGTGRSQFSNAYLQDGETYWMAYQVRLGDDCFVAGNTCSLGDVHHNNWSDGPYGRPSRANRAPIELFLSGAGNGRFIFDCWGCYISNFQNSQCVNTEVYDSGATSPGEWHRFVMKFKIGRAASDNAFITLWHQVDNGAETQVANVSGVPIGYNDTPPNSDYVKFVGLYDWNTTVTTRTTYTKGLIVVKDAAGSPTLSAAELFALMRSL